MNDEEFLSKSREYLKKAEQTAFGFDQLWGKNATTKQSLMVKAAKSLAQRNPQIRDLLRREAARQAKIDLRKLFGTMISAINAFVAFDDETNFRAPKPLKIPPWLDYTSPFLKYAVPVNSVTPGLLKKMGTYSSVLGKWLQANQKSAFTFKKEIDHVADLIIEAMQATNLVQKQAGKTVKLQALFKKIARAFEAAKSFRYINDSWALRETGHYSKYPFEFEEPEFMQNFLDNLREWKSDLKGALGEIRRDTKAINQGLEKVFKALKLIPEMRSIPKDYAL